jgi:hypothetical protein
MMNPLSCYGPQCNIHDNLDGKVSMEMQAYAGDATCRRNVPECLKGSCMSSS